MKKKAVLLILIVAGLSLAFVKPLAKNETVTIVIDAGHGGKDNGVTLNSFTEKDLVEKITNKIKAQNRNKNIILHFTRDNDQFVELSDRVAFINKIKPDLVLSIHVNSQKNASANGMEFYVADKENASHQKSKEAAVKLSEKFAKNHNFKIRGIKEAPFMILKKSEVPAITIEVGFLSNTDDYSYLTDDAQQSKIASTILEFISEYQ